MKIYKLLLIFSLVLITALGFIGCSDGDLSSEKEAYYTITTNVDGGNGTIILTPDQNKYQQGTTVTIEAVPDTNFLFHYWDGDLGGSQKEQIITVERDMSIFGYFLKGIANIDVTTNITSDNLTAGELPVTLTADVNNPNGELSEVRINWGDGTSDTLTDNYANINSSHTYSSEQEYIVTITGINSNGENIINTLDIDLTIIDFADQTLKQAVQDTLNKEPEKEITVYDAQKITTLSAGQDILNDTISSLSGIEHLTNLLDLHLYGHNLSNISYLSNLTNLENLSLSNNDITNLSPLANLTNLTVLTLKRNNISDITTIANFSDLENLSLSYNNITDLSPLSGLNNLNYLYLRNNGLSDLDSLSNLTNLVGLYLDANNISNLSALSGLDLDSLTLGENNISDISSLANLTNLANLYLNNNNISEITTIANFMELNYLNLNNNSISDISSLYDLTGLSVLNLENNSLDLTSGSGDMSVITHLEDNGVDVYY